MSEIDPSDSIPVALDALERTLRRQSEQRIKRALQVQVLLLAGFKRTEIVERLGISGPEYEWAWRKLRDATRQGADEE